MSEKKGEREGGGATSRVYVAANVALKGWPGLDRMLNPKLHKSVS